MMQMRKLSGLALAVVICSNGGVYASVVAGWDVEGVDVGGGVGIQTNESPYTFWATTSEVDHVEARLSLGAGVNPSTTAGQYGFKIASADQTNSLAGAISLDHYIDFSLTVEPGYQLNLHRIELVGQGTSGACSNVVLMTSVDGFSAGNEIASAFPANGTGGFDTDSSGFGGPIDLSAPKYQSLNGTISFHIYGWNSTSGSSPTYIRNLTGDDLVIYGDVTTVSSEGMPLLSLGHTNGMASVSVQFIGTPATNYVLQDTTELTDSNAWETVSAPFSSTTNCMFETTNVATFFRVVPE